MIYVERRKEYQPYTPVAMVHGRASAFSRGEMGDSYAYVTDVLPVRT